MVIDHIEKTSTGYGYSFSKRNIDARRVVAMHAVMLDGLYLLTTFTLDTGGELSGYLPTSDQCSEIMRDWK